MGQVVSLEVYLPMGGQIVDATLLSAPERRNTATEKAAIKERKSAAEIWPDQPAKAAQKDVDARWTVKFARARPLTGRRPGIDIAIPSFGYKSSIAICRCYGFIRRGKVSDGARFDGRNPRDVVTNDNAASDVWATLPILADPTRRGRGRSAASAEFIQEAQGQVDVGTHQTRQCHRACPR